MWLAVKTAAAAVLVAGVGWHFFGLLNRPELWERSIRLRPGFLLPAGLLYLAAHTVWATFFVMLLHAQGARVPWLTGVRAYFVSQFGKYVPGKAWTILLRVGLLRGCGLSPTAVAVSATYETLTSMAAGALLAVCLLPWTGPAVGLNLDSWKGLALLGVAGLPVAAGAIHRVAAKAHASPPVGLLVRGLIQDAAGWVLLGLSLWLVVQAVTPDGPALAPDVFLQDLGAASLSYVAGFVVLVSPGGLGAREFVLQRVLAPQLAPAAGSDAAAVAAAVAVVLRLVWTAFEVAWALGLLWLARPARSIPSAVEPEPVAAGRGGVE